MSTRLSGSKWIVVSPLSSFFPSLYRRPDVQPYCRDLRIVSEGEETSSRAFGRPQTFVPYVATESSWSQRNQAGSETQHRFPSCFHAPSPSPCVMNRSR